MPQEIEKTAVLGDGSFGTVYQGRCRSKDVAVKVLHKQDLDAKTLAAFRKEVEILRYAFRRSYKEQNSSTNVFNFFFFVVKFIIRTLCCSWARARSLAACAS